MALYTNAFITIIIVVASRPFALYVQASVVFRAVVLADCVACLASCGSCDIIYLCL